jgi:hypothetical protein
MDFSPPIHGGADNLDSGPAADSAATGKAALTPQVPRHTALTAAAAAPKILLETLGARPATVRATLNNFCLPLMT